MQNLKVLLRDKQCFWRSVNPTRDFGARPASKAAEGLRVGVVLAECLHSMSHLLHHGIGGVNMPDLNLRNVDAELIAKLKVRAAASKTTLREYCLSILADDAYPEQRFATVIPLTGGPKPILRTAADVPRAVARVNAVATHRTNAHHISCKCAICQPPKK